MWAARGVLSLLFGGVLTGVLWESAAENPREQKGDVSGTVVGGVFVALLGGILSDSTMGMNSTSDSLMLPPVPGGSCER